MSANIGELAHVGICGDVPHEKWEFVVLDSDFQIFHYDLLSWLYFYLERWYGENCLFILENIHINECKNYNSRAVC